jgi:hypothetical protein
VASQSFPTLFTSAAGTGSSANLVASSAGQSARVWQLVMSGTATDKATISFTSAGVSSTLTVQIPANGTVVLPMTGAPWAIADTGTAVTFTAASTSTVCAYYTKAIGG